MLFFYPGLFGLCVVFTEATLKSIAPGFILAELATFVTHVSILRASWYPKYYTVFFFLLAGAIPVLVRLVIYYASEGTWLITDSVQLIVCLLLMITIGTFSPLRNRDCVLFCLVFLASYAFPLSFGSAFPLVEHLFNISVLFLFSTIVVTGNYFLDQLRQKEFNAQRQLLLEKEKSETLISNMLPPIVANRLKENSRVADNFAETTVLFADLVGFTQLSSSMLPSKVVEIIDNIFTRFDAVIENRELEKIKAVGDAYMAVAGVPLETLDHAIAATLAALDMKEQLELLNTEMGESLDIRIGLHSGPLVAGVIGTKKLTYDVWGDTVNVASRMESHSENGKIQISEATYHFIKTKFLIEYRGEIEIKGKGLMKTYYVLGENV